jgi:hypothetical protein
VSAIVITAYNEDRRAINAGVREGLKERANCRAPRIRAKSTPRRVDAGHAEGGAILKAGDVVRFGRDYQQIDAKKGEYMRVSAVDAPNGTVVLQKEDGSVIAWQPKKHNKIEVYDRDTRELAKGDLIRITRNEGEFKNGEGASRLWLGTR